jgi:hypothetical protein
VTLPVGLTHEAFGALIGARRPTVSLALSELIERGAIVRQHNGWLLLESLPDEVHAAPQSEPPVLHDRSASHWNQPPPPPPSPPPPVAVVKELRATMRRLEVEVGRVREEADATLTEARSCRERIRLHRAELDLRRRRAPSSG